MFQWMQCLLCTDPDAKPILHNHARNHIKKFHAKFLSEYETRMKGPRRTMDGYVNNDTVKGLKLGTKDDLLKKNGLFIVVSRLALSTVDSSFLSR